MKRLLSSGPLSRVSWASGNVAEEGILYRQVMMNALTPSTRGSATSLHPVALAAKGFGVSERTAAKWVSRGCRNQSVRVTRAIRVSETSAELRLRCPVDGVV